jgi:diguanylate cyclase (GGDEF)-like protein/PAS domain S-box-containing protein
MLDALPATLISRLVDESLDAVTIIDHAGTVRYLNHAMSTLSGYALADALGLPLDTLLPPNVAAHHQQNLANYLRTSGPSTVLGKVREFAIRHRSGELIPIEMKAVDLGIHDGTRYFGAYMVDLRPRRQMEAAHAALLARLEQEALSDPLTGLPNRRAFEAEAAQMAARAQRNASALTVGIADIDHFKKVNDRYGHPAGDVVLCEISRLIVHAARAADFIGRIGGEEFGLLFPDAAQDQARGVAERIREAVAGARIRTAEGDELRVTISIGLAGVEPGTALSDALAQADSALYHAKDKGRNRVESQDSPAAAPSR